VSDHLANGLRRPTIMGLGAAPLTLQRLGTQWRRSFITSANYGGLGVSMTPYLSRPLEGWSSERAGQDGQPPKSWANQQAPENRRARGRPCLRGKHEPTPAPRGEAQYAIERLPSRDGRLGCMETKTVPWRPNGFGDRGTGKRKRTLERPSGRRSTLKNIGTMAEAYGDARHLWLPDCFLLQGLVTGRDGAVDGVLDGLIAMERR
jgi:hypothetical protein